MFFVVSLSRIGDNNPKLKSSQLKTSRQVAGKREATNNPTAVTLDSAYAFLCTWLGC